MNRDHPRTPTEGSTPRGRRGAGPAALALLAPLLLVAACDGGEEVPVAPPDLLELEADQVMMGVETRLTEEGIRRAHLRADTVYFLEEGSRARVRRYTIDFFGSGGERISTLTALDGVYDLGSGDMEARREVEVVDADSVRRLVTERLVYDVSANKLRSDVDFTLYRGSDTIRGTGFVTDPKMDTLVVTRPGGVLPPGEGPGGPDGGR